MLRWVQGHPKGPYRREAGEPASETQRSLHVLEGSHTLRMQKQGHTQNGFFLRASRKSGYLLRALMLAPFDKIGSFNFHNNMNFK